MHLPANAPRRWVTNALASARNCLISSAVAIAARLRGFRTLFHSNYACLNATYYSSESSINIRRQIASLLSPIP